VEGRLKRLADLDRQAAAADFWSDQNRARGVIEEASQTRALTGPFAELEKRLEDASVMIQLAEADPDAAHVEEAAREAETALAEAERQFRALDLQSLMSGRLDAHNAFLTLHAGAGGTESCDWAEMLFRMYRRYCERRGFAVEVLEYQPGDEAGVRRVSFSVDGPYAYGYMKAERGVHRLVRISPFDANKRRHTSFAALDVVAEVEDDVEVEIKEDDLKTDTYRASGAGGQHVNRTDSAVRITHLPTGIVVACQAERSQHSNKARALKILTAKLYEYEADKKRKEMEKFYGEKGEIAWGRQIRSYVLQPYTLAKDHRTETEIGNVQGVLDGEIDPFIESYLKKFCGREHSG
jgi:peptide chain release factor 2